MKYSLKNRLKHIKLHLNCLIKNHKSFISNKISWKEFKYKNWFFIKGILRTFIP